MINLLIPGAIALAAGAWLYFQGEDSESGGASPDDGTGTGDTTATDTGAASGGGYSGGYNSGAAYATPGSTSATDAASVNAASGMPISNAVFRKKPVITARTPISVPIPGGAAGLKTPVIKAPVTPIVPIPNQSVNASQTSVANAQKVLQKLGFAFGALDGLYGPKTAQAWANAVAKYPPAQGPDYDRRATFTRVNGTTALVYRPSAERLAAAAAGKPAPVSSAITPAAVSAVKPAAVPIAAIKPNVVLPVTAKPVVVPVGAINFKPQPPAGYDKAKAKSLAPSLAAHLKSKGAAGYDRNVLKVFQKAAGIAQDGIYGNGSYAALKYFTANAPASFYPKQGVTTYPWA